MTLIYHTYLTDISCKNKIIRKKACVHAKTNVGMKEKIKPIPPDHAKSKIIDKGVKIHESF